MSRKTCVKCCGRSREAGSSLPPVTSKMCIRDSGGSHGYYHLTEKRIAIQEGMSELQTVKTAIHEIAHSKLHALTPEAAPAEQAARPDSRTREVQAESVAYAVCQHYGLDTSDYSFGYVAGWSLSLIHI